MSSYDEGRRRLRIGALAALLAGPHVLSAQVTGFVNNPATNSTDFANAVSNVGGTLNTAMNFSTATVGALPGTLYSSLGVTLTGTGIFGTVVNNAGPDQDGTTTPVSTGEGLFAPGNYLGPSGNYSTVGCFTCSGSLTVSFASPVMGVGLFTIDLYNPSNAHPVSMQAFTGPNGTGTSLGTFTSAAFNFQPDAVYFMGVVSTTANIGSLVFTDPVDSLNGDVVGIASIEFATSGGGGSPPPPPSEAEPSGPVLYGTENDATTGPGICFVGDPVNCATGNFVETQTDLRVAKGRGRILNLTRTYNALDAAAASSPGAMGFGWTHSYASFLSIDGSGNVTVHRGNGATAPFTKSGSTFTAPAFVIATLVLNGDGTYTFTLPDQRADIFSASGRLLRQTDRNGYQTTLAYDGSGRLTSVTDPSGRSLQFRYGGNGLISSATDPIGRKVSYGYDSSQNLTSATDAGGNVTQFGYDSSHRMVKMTDPNGGVATNSYDSSNRVVSQTDPAGRTMTFVYGAGTTTITDGNGHVTEQTFTNSRLTAITRGVGSPVAGTWTFTYDAAGNQISGNDPNGHTWHATYDSHGNQLTFTDPLNRMTSGTYNAQNNLLTNTDPLGVTTTYTYDIHGNLTRVSRPLTGTSQTLTRSYQHGAPSHPGDITAIVDPNGQTWSLVYDANGDLAGNTDPEGDFWTGSYNGIGWLTSAVPPRGHAAGANPADFTVTRLYSELGQIVRATDALGHVTGFSYDPNRNLVSATDANGNTTHFAYDRDNELIKTTRADGSVLMTSFDAAGNMIGQTDGLGRTTSYSYDARNRRVAASDPLGRTTLYGYDGAGNMTGITDPSNQKTTLTYDAANQVVGIAYSDGTTPAVSLTYDLDGQRIGMTDGTGTTAYQFDSLHRLTGTTDGAGKHAGYGYDLRGGLTGITYPSGKQVTRGFDAAGRLISVTDWMGNRSTFHDDEDGNLVGIGYGNGVTGAFGYDRTDLVISMNYSGAHDQFLSFAYTRDNLGRVSHVDADDEAADAKYAYTPIGQVSAAGMEYFAYDPADNLVKMDAAALEYDTANELIRQNDDGTANLTYDSRGNRAQSSVDGRTQTYRYDQANRLTGFGTHATYAYNGDGLRMRKVVDGASRAMVWDLAQRLALLLADGTNQFVYGPRGRPLEQIGADGSVLWFHQDQVGSTRALTDRLGHVAARYEYNAYGGRPTDGPDRGQPGLTPLMFAGQYTDSESGLQYLRARYYDPGTGQFLTRDPMSALTRDPYLYASGDPVNRTDASGLDDDSGGDDAGIADLVASLSDPNPDNTASDDSGSDGSIADDSSKPAVDTNKKATLWDQLVSGLSNFFSNLFTKDLPAPQPLTNPQDAPDTYSAAYTSKRDQVLTDLTTYGLSDPGVMRVYNDIQQLDASNLPAGTKAAELNQILSDNQAVLQKINVRSSCTGK